jgi:hypothetical protein
MSDGLDEDDLSAVEDAIEFSDDDSDYRVPSEPQLKDFSDQVGEIVTSLMRLSVIMRKPVPHDHIMKWQDILDTSFYEQVDISHVQHKFPNADKSLVERLGKAISKRRHYLKYRESHSQKMAQGMDIDDDGKTIAIAESTVASSLPEVLRTAPHLEIDLDDRISEASQSSYASSGATEGKLRPPPWPKEGLDGKPFKCPLCHLIVMVSSTLAWT